jgi:hypothetical protein
VTVVDPRHPLFDQTFPLLHIKNKQELVPCCVVHLAEGAERLIPIGVTDLATAPPVIFPIPIDISSLHNLTQAFMRIIAQIEKECGDGTTGNSKLNGGDSFGTSHLENTDCSPAGNGFANDRPDLLPDCWAMAGRGEA